MRRIASMLAVLPLVVLAAGAPGSAALLRELEYSVSATSNGVPYQARVRVAFVGGDASSAMFVDVTEAVDGEERTVSDVSIDRSGAIACAERSRMTIEQEAIVALISLESENLSGVERGDHWERAGSVPRGRHRTSFAVLRAPSDGYIDMAVARNVALDDGSTAEWRGKMTYDERAVVPSAIVLTGSLRAGTGLDEPSRNVSLAIRLTHDSYSGSGR